MVEVIEFKKVGAFYEAYNACADIVAGAQGKYIEKRQGRPMSSVSCWASYMLFDKLAHGGYQVIVDGEVWE